MHKFVNRYFFIAFLIALSLAWAQVEVQEGIITVTGSGIAYGEPDLAFFDVGVNIVSENVAEATEEANRLMQAVIETLQAAGIAQEDIRTVSFNIWREERYSPVGEEMTPVYRVINTVRVTVREVAAVSTLLGQAIEAGANNVGGVQYTFADPLALENQAREEAMRQARQRAGQLASLAGVELAEVRSIVEAPEFGLPFPEPRVALDMAEGLGGVPVAGGQLAVRVSLQVSFAITQPPEEPPPTGS